MVENTNGEATLKKYKVVSETLELTSGASHKTDDVIELDPALPETEALLESGSVVAVEEEAKSGDDVAAGSTFKKYKVLREFTGKDGAVHAADTVAEIDPSVEKVDGLIADGYIAEDVEA